ncbi:hypothetical protein SCUP515_10852 [Seiridium cupressi]
MTTRNLNRTWRDVVWAQYAADLEADVPFPVRYLIHSPQWKCDIMITIPSKIEYQTFRRAVLDFAITVRPQRQTEPIWEGEHISVRPRRRPPSLENSNVEGSNQTGDHVTRQRNSRESDMSGSEGNDDEGNDDTIPLDTA